jgi:SAM-dependent methyltransferase
MAQLVVPPEFRRSADSVVQRTDESARFLIRHVCDALGLADLSGTELLDVGCGTKFSEAFLNHDIPVKHYVGVDVYGKMIEFLQREVDDPRFEYVHFDVRNELYNPEAPPMTAASDLGVGPRRFDLIWLFSVFTHLNPDDSRSMLHLLRRHVRDAGALFFTAFLNERSSSEYGATEALSRAIENAVAENRELPPELVEVLGRSAESTEGTDEAPDFVDLYPDQPLMAAMYSRRYLFELVDEAGWRVETILPPNEFAQHAVVCRPV